MFMFVFIVKVSISVAPLLLYLNSDKVRAVSIQLDHEKSEKEDPDKDAFKEKSSFDECCLLTFFDFNPILIETNVLHNLGHSILTQLCHPVVPTPPPNV